MTVILILDVLTRLLIAMIMMPAQKILAIKTTDAKMFRSGAMITMLVLLVPMTTVIRMKDAHIHRLTVMMVMLVLLIAVIPPLVVPTNL
jgi:hypothetical protein